MSFFFYATSLYFSQHYQDKCNLILKSQCTASGSDFGFCIDKNWDSRVFQKGGYVEQVMPQCDLDFVFSSVKANFAFMFLS